VGDWATTKATYRFWNNPQVQPDDIIGTHQHSTSTRLEQHQAILAIFNKISFRRLRTLSLPWSEGKSVSFESYNNTIFPLIVQQ
jgi:hypothetical protein